METGLEDRVTEVAPLHRAPANIDRKLAGLILLLTLLTYAYIFQGLGWNQMAHFATIRSIVERGTADISPFADATKDTMVLGTRQYSGKPPGLPLLGVPVYFVLIHVERWFGIAYASPGVWLKNLHAMTVLLCAVPGAALNVLLYFAFRREGATPRTSMLLAGASPLARSACRTRACLCRTFSVRCWSLRRGTDSPAHGCYPEMRSSSAR